MRKIIVNLILLIALGVIGVMVVGIFLYNYIPNDVTIVKAKTYQANTETTKVLSEAGETGNLLGELTGNMNTTQDDIKTTIIYQTYEVTAGKLQQYKNTKEYQPGKKADPFDEPVSGEDISSGSSGTASGNQNSGNTGNPGDGTLFGTGNQK